MAGFSPTAALTVLQLGQGIIKSAQNARSYKNANAELATRQQAELQQRQKVQDVNTQRRRDRLRQIMAAQRARFGAQGIEAGIGSAEAVLKGLTKQGDRERQDANELEAFKTGSINDRYGRQKRKNLLEASSARKRMAFDLLRQGIRTIPLLEI